MAQTSKIINILLADDHHLVRDGIRSLLTKYPDFNVIAEAGDGVEVLNVISDASTTVDLVLADINMPNMNGLELVRIIAEKHPKTKVLILSMLDHEKYVSQALQAGAKGYLLKSVNQDELVFAIRQVSNNSFYLCTELTYQLLGKNLMTVRNINGTVNQVRLDFSLREIEILELIADGYTNSEIADKLFTSKRTIEGHRLQLISRTGVRNTAALVKFCIANGILNYQSV